MFFVIFRVKSINNLNGMFQNDDNRKHAYFGCELVVHGIAVLWQYLWNRVFLFLCDTFQSSFPADQEFQPHVIPYFLLGFRGTNTIRGGWFDPGAQNDRSKIVGVNISRVVDRVIERRCEWILFFSGHG